MLATATSATILGVQGRPVTVEVHVSDGLPAFTVVGQPDPACREVRDRARAAVLSSGLTWPVRKVTVNLAPSSERKVGTGLDLAVALGVLVATMQLPPECLRGVSAIGELGLDGSVRPVAGVVSLVGCLPPGTVVVPTENARQARLGGRHDIRPVDTLGDLVLALRDQGPWPTPEEPPPPPPEPPPPDLADVRGQPVARQALEIAAAGGHHILLVGSPGSGKTMLARRLPGLLPALDTDAALEVTQVMSAAGVDLPGDGLVVHPPFRAPHHSASLVALVGGGTAAMRPGEVSMAARGVLFLDEMGEFQPTAIDALRQPLEEGVVRIARARASVTLPARFLLVAATNPCPCGDAGEPAGCRCSGASLQRYVRRLSGPILDRFDLRVAVQRPAPSALLAEVGGEATGPVAERVAAVRALAAARGVAVNADIPDESIDHLAPLDRQARRLLEGALVKGRLSGRGLARVRRVGRTVADLAGADPGGPLGPEHVAVAMALRGALPAGAENAA